MLPFYPVSHLKRKNKIVGIWHQKKSTFQLYIIYLQVNYFVSFSSFSFGVIFLNNTVCKLKYSPLSLCPAKCLFICSFGRHFLHTKHATCRHMASRTVVHLEKKQVSKISYRGIYSGKYISLNILHIIVVTCNCDFFFLRDFFSWMVRFGKRPTECPLLCLLPI